MKMRLLVIDDQKTTRDLFERFLSGADVHTASGVREALGILDKNEVDIIVSDIRMDGMDGIEGLAVFREKYPEVPVIMMTAYATVEGAVEAMKRGAFDYIKKPFELDEMEVVINRAFAHSRLLRENRSLRSIVERLTAPDIVGESSKMKQALELAGRVAATDATVLILGESGTGKDLIAKYIHRSSNRIKNPFHSINCSAIPENLLESELFGYEKGAFTGASSSRAGFFEECDGGTLFLDEVGDMSEVLQPKLLRVLQDGEFYPVGGRSPKKSDVRIICATNKNLKARVKDGKFREDLYYRISQFPITIPPLRERREDIPLLINHFTAKHGERYGRKIAGIDGDVVDLLSGLEWKGNVRELENVIVRAILSGSGGALTADDLPDEYRMPDARAAGAGETSKNSYPRDMASLFDELSYREARNNFEKEYFEWVLRAAGGNVNLAAEMAGIHRATFYEKLAKLGIKT